MTDPISMSVVVPVRNDPGSLRECLAALRLQLGPGTELIVVDDASTDDTAFAAEAAGAQVLRLEQRQGPAAARNLGARWARGTTVLFVDADVVIWKGAIHRVLRALAEHPEISAVFGSYDAAPRAAGTISRYRNLLHHYVHQHGETDSSTFWAGCGAIRRSIFLEIGGFDETRYVDPSIEDIDLGHRLRQAGHRILLDRGLQGTHLKRWTLLSVLRTDICHRALPWCRLLLQTGEVPDDLNLRRDQRLGAVLTALAVLGVLLAPLHPGWLLFGAAAFVGVVILNRSLHAFMYRQQGLGFAVAGIGLHTLYYLSGLAGCGVALLEMSVRALGARASRRDQRMTPSG